MHNTTTVFARPDIGPIVHRRAHKRLVHPSKFKYDEGDDDEAKFGNLTLPYVMSVPYQALVRAGDSIHVKGTVIGEGGANSTSINVSLLYQALETYNTVPESVKKWLTLPKNKLAKVGKIVLLAKFSNSHLELFQQYQGDECTEIAKVKLETPLDGPFDLAIRFIGKHQFQLHLNNKFIASNQIVLPIWAIQYVRVEGNLKLAEAPKIMLTSYYANNRNN